MSAHPRSGRGFGGQVGIVWCKRRRASASSPPFSASSSCSSNVGFPPSDESGDKAKGGPERGSSVALLSWDDDLCLPIYHVPAAKAHLLPEATGCPHVTSSEDDSDGEEDGDDDERTCAGCLPPRPSAVGAAAKHESSSTAVAVPHWIHARAQGQRTAQHPAVSGSCRPKRQRTYTTTKSRLRVLGFSTSCSSAGEAPREATGSEAGPNGASGVSLSRRSGEAPVKPSRAAHRAPTQPSTRVVAASTSDDLNFDNAKPGRRETRTKRRRVSPAASVSTPLSVVRKYFQDLDMHHPLLLEKNHSSVPSNDDNGGRQRRTMTELVDGRSVRPILESNPIVSREYENHHRSCRDAGVSPLSWKPFLQQRPLYHATMYEGMLDD